MQFDRFTRTESAVILALMRNPEHSDTEISRAIGMNLFTFNKIKNSLMKRKMLEKYYVPNYGKLGLEILSVSHGSGMDSFNCQTEGSLPLKSGEYSLPHMSIFGIMEGNNGVVFHVIKDFTHLKRLMRIKEKMIDSSEMFSGSIEQSIFSMKDLRIERFFDVHGLLEEDVGERKIPVIPPENPAQEAASREWSEFFRTGSNSEPVILEQEERGTLLELLRNPERKERDIIRDLNLSRYRFRKIKDMLLQEGFIKPFYGTNVIGMGYEVLIFTHMRFKAGQDPRELFEIYESRMPSNLMIVAFDHSEVIGLGIFRNLTEGSRAQMNMRKAMMDYGFLDGEPDIKIFSLPNCRDEPSLTFNNPLEDLGEVMDPGSIE